MNEVVDKIFNTRGDALDELAGVMGITRHTWETKSGAFLSYHSEPDEHLRERLVNKLSMWAFGKPITRLSRYEIAKEPICTEPTNR